MAYLLTCKDTAKILVTKLSLYKIPIRATSYFLHKVRIANRKFQNRIVNYEYYMLLEIPRMKTSPIRYAHILFMNFPYCFVTFMNLYLEKLLLSSLFELWTQLPVSIVRAFLFMNGYKSRKSDIYWKCNRSNMYTE